MARVEGEGALELEIRENRLQELKLRIFEPPRYFEKFLEGRSYREIPDTVARICGICPVAYQMSAVGAIEGAFRVSLDDWVTPMRRVMYCGEWIQSHALHVHLLAAPDFLGYDSAISMAADHPEAVRRGLRLQHLGNRLIRLFGARSVHPVGVCAGGFFRAPSMAEVEALLDDLRPAIKEAEALVAWAASLALPEDHQAFTSVALRHSTDYPLESGDRIVSDAGLDIPLEAFEAHFEEYHVPHSTALYAHLHGSPYLVGPLARLNLFHERLPAPVKEALGATGIPVPSDNMFHSIVARAVEIHYAFVEAVRLLEAYQPPAQPSRTPTPVAREGVGASEAPRGLLWHRYRFNERGEVTYARIVPPTSQNQARIEEDLRQSLEGLGLHHEDDALRLRGETVIRNYDPCISCSTHFLRLAVRRDEPT